MGFIDPNQREGEDKRLLYQDARYRVITLSIPKASTKRTLAQNILLVTKPPINNLEEARIGLNSLPFGQGGKNPHLWALTEHRDIKVPKKIK